MYFKKLILNSPYNYQKQADGQWSGGGCDQIARKGLAGAECGVNSWLKGRRGDIFQVRKTSRKEI